MAYTTLDQMTDSAFEELVQSSEVLIVLFTLPWSGLCANIGPLIENISKDYSDLKFVECDSPNAPMCTGKFGVNKVPTIIAFKNTPDAPISIGRRTGIQSEENYRVFFDTLANET